MATKPTFEQGQLHLQIFEQRREARLRQARDWFFRNYVVENLDDVMRIAGPFTEGGTFVMMVLTYWEQACAFLNHGLLHEELFFETNGEFFGAWESVKPVIREFREKFNNKLFLTNLEQAAQRYEKWMESRSPGHIATMRQMMKQMRPKTAQAA